MILCLNKVSKKNLMPFILIGKKKDYKRQHNKKG